MGDRGEQASRELEPGTTFGRYEIVRLLGKGGMGAVYEARNVTLRKRVALKTLLVPTGGDSLMAERFVREGQTASRIRHPHIVEVFDAGTHDDVPYLVMEYLEGESLAALIRREGALAPARVAKILLPVAAAIATAHEAGVVHRDIKPENIFLAREGRGDVAPKVLDFGISKVNTGTGQVRLTTTGALLGTPMYMSPEQARGAETTDARSDQYSLGVVLYECATGAEPYRAKNFLALLTEIGAGRFERPRAARADVPEALERLILRAMAQDPDARFPSVRDLGRALLEFADPATRARWASEFEPVASAGPDALAAPSSERSGGGLDATLVAGTPPGGAIPISTLARAVTEIDAPSRARRGRWIVAAGGMLVVAALAVVGVRLSHGGGDAERVTLSPPHAAIAAPAPPPPTTALQRPAAAPPVEAPPPPAPSQAPVAAPPAVDPHTHAGATRPHRPHAQQAAVTGAHTPPTTTTTTTTTNAAPQPPRTGIHADETY